MGCLKIVKLISVSLLNILWLNYINNLHLINTMTVVLLGVGIALFSKSRLSNLVGSVFSLVYGLVIFLPTFKALELLIVNPEMNIAHPLSSFNAFYGSILISFISGYWVNSFITFLVIRNR